MKRLSGDKGTNVLQQTNTKVSTQTTGLSMCGFRYDCLKSLCFEANLSIPAKTAHVALFKKLKNRLIL